SRSAKATVCSYCRSTIATRPQASRMWRLYRHRIHGSPPASSPARIGSRYPSARSISPRARWFAARLTSELPMISGSPTARAIAAARARARRRALVVLAGPVVTADLRHAPAERVEQPALPHAVAYALADVRRLRELSDGGPVVAEAARGLPEEPPGPDDEVREPEL